MRRNIADIILWDMTLDDILRLVARVVVAVFVCLVILGIAKVVSEGANVSLVAAIGYVVGSLLLVLLLAWSIAKVLE